MNELEILFPEATRIKVGRRLVSIRPVEFRDFDKFGQASAELMGILAKGDMTLVYTWAERAGVLRTILSACTDMSSWRINRLPISVAVELMLHVIAQNSRFFGQALVNAAHLLAGEQSPKS